MKPLWGPWAKHPPGTRSYSVAKGVKALLAALAALLAATLLLCRPPAQASATTVGVDWVTLSWSTYNRVYYGNYNTPIFTVTDSAGYPTFAYCVDPTTPAPASGNWGTQALENVVGGNAPLVRAALWFGYGGPGFDSSMWPSTWEDGSAMDARSYYCATHIILSYLSTQRLGYAYYNAGSAFISYAAGSFMGMDLRGNVVNANSTLFQIQARACEVPADFNCYFLSCGQWDNVQHMVAQDYYRESGTVALCKASSDPDISSQNPLYSLSGASYGVFSDRELSVRAATIVLDENGQGSAEGLASGTYWVVEELAPNGFAQDATVYEVEVAAGQTSTLQLCDVPQTNPVEMLVYKGDGDDVLAIPSGTPLAGAEFVVCFYGGAYDAESLPETPLRSWVVRTDEDGWARLDAEHLVSGDEFFTDADGAYVLPLGTVVIRETKAPAGYDLSGEACVVYVWPEGTDAHVWTYKPAEFQDFRLHGAIEVLKVDADGMEASPQGDASLEGAEFSVISLIDTPITVGGERFQKGEVVTTIVTDASGYGSTGDASLPLGLYRIQETKAPQGYTAATVAWDVRVAEEGIRLEGDASGAQVDDDGRLVVPNAVVRGGLCIQKTDADTGQAAPLGQATLEGAVFAVVNANASPVVVNGVRYASGETVMTLTTNKNGAACTEEAVLPYGTYQVYEVSAPDGYTLNALDSLTLRVDAQGATATTEPLSDRLVRGDAMLAKVETDSQAAMPHVAFKVTSLSTGEWHVLVADEHGYLNTSSGVTPHSANTNASDLALDARGVVVDESALSWQNGVWFSGSTSQTTAVADDLGALPYDRYRFDELPTSATYGHKLVSFDVAVREDGAMVDLGFVNDDVISVRTTALGGNSGTHEETPGVTATIVDTVEVTGLEQGRAYRVSGMLVDKQTGQPVTDASGTAVTAQASLVAQGAEQTVQVVFHLDSSRLAGRSTVVFENLYREEVLVASHADLGDAGQTVHWTRSPEPERPSIPKTGDESDLLGVLILGGCGLAICVCAATILVVSRKKD